MPESEEVDVENQNQLEDSLPDIKRFVHLDFSGAPPSVEYIEQVFQLLSGLKASGVFIEYSDSFPFFEKMEKLTNEKRSYTRDEILKIGSLADQYSLEIVPVVDVCSNAFFITKHFESLRFRVRNSFQSDPIKIFR